ncbi:hypothetical protein [Serratia quinivorans]|uniref:hypothetical protein n=1 Tax=Serratia quinivorans TaxID=137545 RepID=UPI001C465AB7|nr:hypothetical protein [Serratia quinivorans]MBV6692280.1 hypothetical protein [Serratia quinivorans]
MIALKTKRAIERCLRAAFFFALRNTLQPSLIIGSRYSQHGPLNFTSLLAGNYADVEKLTYYRQMGITVIMPDLNDYQPLDKR